MVVVPVSPATSRPARAVKRILARLPEARVLVLDQRRSAIHAADPIPEDPRVTRVSGRGRGSELAQLDGLRYAFEHDFAGALTVEVDGRIDPRGLRPLAESRLDGELLLGIRGPHRPFSWIDPRSWPVGLIGMVSRWTLGAALVDPATPFRLYGRRALALVSEPPQAAPANFQLGSLKRILAAGLRVQEIPLPASRRSLLRSALLSSLALLRLRKP